MTSPSNSGPIGQVVVTGNADAFVQNVTVGRHTFNVDEPAHIGGTGAAPDPYDYLMAGLGACTSMTVGLYARKRGIPLKSVRVSLKHSRIHAKDCEECETKQGMLDRIELDLQLTGDLTAEQRAQLIEVAGKCPVHRTLTSEINIRLNEVP